jgi:hypothetical protein
MAGVAFLHQIRNYRPHWLPYLAVSWAVLQLGDILTTYWGLSFPTIMEANPLMAGLVQMPFCVIFVKMGLTLAASLFLLRNRWYPALTSAPMLIFLNCLMFYVCLNNTTLIVKAAGFTPGRLAALVLPGWG